MAGSLGSLNINLSLDSVKFSQGLTKAQQSTVKFAQSTNRSLNSVEKNVQKMQKSIQLADHLFSTNLFVATPIKSLVSLADAHTEISNRMKLVTSNSVESARAMQAVFDVSLRTAQSVDATAQIYQRFAQNAQQLGISQTQVASLTETVSKAVAISGASAASAEAALTQFGQALASGVFRGQEFNSVMEQAPGLAQAIARGLGVTNGELRNMANSGKLTMDVLIPALEKVKASVDQQFSTRVLTVSAAFENLKTATTQWVGELNTGTISTNTLAKGLNFVANNLAEAIKMATLFTSALAVGHLGNYAKPISRAFRYALSPPMSVPLALPEVRLKRRLRHKQISARGDNVRCAVFAKIPHIKSAIKIRTYRKLRIASLVIPMVIPPYPIIPFKIKDDGQCIAVDHIRHHINLLYF
ncbi:hypothetical protein A1D23_09255 [Chelonobacter oris]|uniref:tape measure protein n=1 Tax=Chelonobacter oris TaxID=505317 RepID=UPI0024486C7B|nr:tape measure protein [Chelonobacter oris]MDH3000606.1 hypothetical protein [Chelonobacter oris]